MKQPDGPIPQRFDIARRSQWVAAFACALFAITCFVGWPLGYMWPSVVALIGFLPAVFLFNIHCYACGWPAFTDYPAEQRLSEDRRFWTRFWGKDYGGFHLPLRSQCTKCGAPFA
tara:strand:+ start:474 stop:818 length:345 start_codon:yes stop_codon:yes gene_type:complete